MREIDQTLESQLRGYWHSLNADPAFIDRLVGQVEARVAVTRPRKWLHAGRQAVSRLSGKVEVVAACVVLVAFLGIVGVRSLTPRQPSPATGGGERAVHTPSDKQGGGSGTYNPTPDPTKQSGDFRSDLTPAIVVEKLVANGFTAAISSESSKILFGAKREVTITANGVPIIFVSEFDSRSAAENAFTTASDPQKNTVSWAKQPHFMVMGNLLINVGTNDETLANNFINVLKR